MKKILIFSLAYYPKVGGAEVALKEITDRIVDCEFHMITLRFDSGQAKEERMGNVRVHRVGSGSSYLSKMLFVVRASQFAKRLHAKEKFDGAWGMMSYMALPIILAKLPIPYALTLQEGDTEAHVFHRVRILPFLYLIKKGFRNARAVTAISNHLAEWAKKMGYKGEVELIPNGVDIEKFSIARVPHEGIKLVTTSRLVHKNAVDDIIRALSSLPEAVLVVAGVGEKERELRALAEVCGVSSRVEWLGFVTHDDLPKLLAGSDIFIRPSRSEGMGNSFIEAMAAGVPVVATQEGGLKDFITPDVAWVVEKNHPDQIALQIKDILGNPGHTAEVVERARALSKNYDWARIAEAMRERVFARII